MARYVNEKGEPIVDTALEDDTWVCRRIDFDDEPEWFPIKQIVRCGECRERKNCQYAPIQGDNGFCSWGTGEDE